MTVTTPERSRAPRPGGPPEGCEARARPVGPRHFGDREARLLAGPPEAAGPESLDAHLDRLGPVPADRGPEDLLDEIEASGLAGRGGGGFRVARKLAAARHAGVPPLVIVNAAESEPASRKDRALCSLRPHLVLDGAAVAAAVVGAGEVVIYTHRGVAAVAGALRSAVDERRRQGLADPGWKLSTGPDRYVAGEASAAASFVSGGPAKPRFLTAPLARHGVDGRPTVVHNAETMAHLGLVARRGALWWREAGTPAAPGSRLVTVAHGAPGGGHPAGRVLEVIEPVTVGAILEEVGADGPPSGVLVGGYAGRWLAGDTAWLTGFEPAALAAVGASPGCGLLAVLPHGACPLVETARLAAYLAAESAGQCGPCVFGLGAVAEVTADLASGRARRRDLRRLHGDLAGVVGRGGCHHPDGVAGMVASALHVFADDVARHVRGRPCPGAGRPPALAVPSPGEGWR